MDSHTFFFQGTPNHQKSFQGLLTFWVLFVRFIYSMKVKMMKLLAICEDKFRLFILPDVVINNIFFYNILIC